VTTPETVDAVLKVFAGSVNHELVASLNRAGALAVGLTGIDALLAEAEQLDPALARSAASCGRMPACSSCWRPIAICPWWPAWAGDRAGNIYNVNADQMAVACAAAFVRGN